jgi:hypothetical protein
MEDHSTDAPEDGRQAARQVPNVDGLKIARRGYSDTPEAGTWVPIEPGWEVKDVLGGDEIWVRYTNPVSGEVIAFPEGGRQ